MQNHGWPNFFIVGAAKAGTTSLYTYLRQHPQIYMSPVKEPHFFSKPHIPPEHLYLYQFVSDEDEYLRLFADAGKHISIGEASTSYLWDAECPRQIHERIPSAKIIVSLRDPIDRAYSHYLMTVRDGIQSLPFYEALLENLAGTRTSFSCLYIELGLYYEQIKRYLDTFGPEQVLVLMFEDLKQDPREGLEQVADFLNLDRNPMQAIRFDAVHNPYLALRNKLARGILGIHSLALHKIYRALLPQSLRIFVRNRVLYKEKDKPPLDPQSRALLQKIYAPELDALEKLLKRDLNTLRKVWS